MNGPSARALREGGIGGSIPYKIGVTLIIKLDTGGPLPPEWRKKTTLQAPFGEYGQVLRIDCQEAQGVAFVEYEDKRDAEDAEREMNGKSILGKPIQVTLARAPDQRRGFGFGRTVDIEERIAELARRHRLDEAATARLASVFHDRARLGCDLNRDFEELSEHLSASNKPSALVSMRLADLRAGRSIGPCKYAGGRRGTGMCEVDEPSYHPSNGASAHSLRGSGESHGREEGRREHRQRSRERERDRDRDRAQPGRAEERGAQKRSREEDQPEKSRKQGREAPASEGRHRERSRERKQSPKRGKEHCRSASNSEAGKKTQGRREHDRGAKSRSRQKEKKPREGKVSGEHRSQADGGSARERAQSSGSSGSRLRKKKAKAGGKEKREQKDEQRKDPKKKQKRRSESSSSESPGKADQKRLSGSKQKKAKSPSPSRRRRKKSGSSSSNDSG